MDKICFFTLHFLSFLKKNILLFAFFDVFWICSAKLSFSSIVTPRYLYEDTFSTASPFKVTGQGSSKNTLKTPRENLESPQQIVNNQSTLRKPSDHSEITHLFYYIFSLFSSSCEWKSPSIHKNLTNLQPCCWYRGSIDTPAISAICFCLTEAQGIYIKIYVSNSKTG